jgi:hypothetical protein
MNRRFASVYASLADKADWTAVHVDTEAADQLLDWREFLQD